MPSSNLFNLMLGANNLPGYGSTTFDNPPTKPAKPPIGTGFPNTPEFPGSTVLGDAPGFNLATIGNYDPSNPNSQLSQLLQTRNTYRNLNLANILDESNKDYTNIFAAGPSDALVDAYRNRRDILKSGLTSRGLRYSGAKDITKRALDQFYGQGVTDIAKGAQQQEFGRETGLVNSLQGILDQDLAVQNALSELALAEREFRATKNVDDYVNKLNRITSGIKGTVTLAASALGAAYGAQGGSGFGIGGEGGFTGALQGANFGGGIVSGGGNQYPQQPQYQQTVGGGPSVSSYLGGKNAGLNSYYNAVNAGLIVPGTEQANQLFNAAIAYGGY